MLFAFCRKKNTANGGMIEGSTMAAWVSTSPGAALGRGHRRGGLVGVQVGAADAEHPRRHVPVRVRHLEGVAGAHHVPLASRTVSFDEPLSAMFGF